MPGKDYCDMAGDYGREPEDLLDRQRDAAPPVLPAWQGNVSSGALHDVARQLCGDGMTIDYDQLLAKQPYKDDAMFAWHQDMAYWPDTPDRRTATFWLAVDDSTLGERVHALRAGHEPRGVVASARAGVRRAGRVTCARH